MADILFEEVLIRFLDKQMAILSLGFALGAGILAGR